MSIIQRDIEFYTEMAEQHRTDLRRCATGEEQLHRTRMLLAIAVYQAMLQYQAVLP